MFSVNMNGMSNANDRIHNCVWAVRNGAQEIDEVRAVLSRMSGMEGVLYSLNKIKEGLIKSGTTMHRMEMALEDAVHVYNRTENNIASNADNARMVFFKPGIGINDFTPIRNITKTVKFI